jgi:hypothetical protein
MQHSGLKFAELVVRQARLKATFVLLATPPCDVRATEYVGGCSAARRKSSTTLAVIFTRSGGHLSKLGMIRTEVKDGGESADIHG